MTAPLWRLDRPDRWTERLTLTVIADPSVAPAGTVFARAREALKAGCRCIQLRDKISASRDLFLSSARLRELTLEFGALLILNDRLDIALGCGADGVHLGPDDIPVAEARRITPPGLILGYSTSVPEEAREAQASGADYIGCGALYGTSTKSDAGPPIGISRLHDVASTVAIPVVGIGGIGIGGVAAVARTAAAGVAVIGAVMAAPSAHAATRALLEEWRSERG